MDRPRIVFSDLGSFILAAAYLSIPHCRLSQTTPSRKSREPDTTSSNEQASPSVISAHPSGAERIPPQTVHDSLHESQRQTAHRTHTHRPTLHTKKSTNPPLSTPSFLRRAKARLHLALLPSRRRRRRRGTTPTSSPTPTTSSPLNK